MLNGWKTATAAGAVLKGGADQMIQSLSGTVYVLGDYADAVKRNSKELAATNMGVGEASMMFGNVSKRLGTFQKGLLAVGIGYEQQLDIMAQAAANIRAGTEDPTKKITDEQVAARTKEYSMQLAKLSALTGASASELAKKKAADEQEAAFQGFIRQLGETAGPKALEAFRAMPASLQKLAFETSQFGGPMTAATATFKVLNPQQAAFAETLGIMSRKGNLTIDTMIAEAKARKDGINAETIANRQINQIEIGRAHV